MMIKIHASIAFLVLVILALYFLHTIKLITLDWMLKILMVGLIVNILVYLFIQANKKYRSNKKQYDRTAPWNLKTTDKRD